MYHLSSSRILMHLMHGMMYYAFCKHDIIYNPMTNHCSSLQTRKRNLKLDICLYVYFGRNINNLKLEHSLPTRYFINNYLKIKNIKHPLIKEC